MAREGRKTAKVVEELTLFFFKIGATKVQSNLEIGDAYIKIEFSANYLPEYEEEIDYLEKCLGNEQRNDGMEDVYWEVIGSGTSGDSSQLLLVGMMIDAYEMTKENQEVKLLLYKEF